MKTSIKNHHPENCSLKTEYDGSDEFLTAYDAADFLRVPYQSVMNMTSNGQLPYFKLGRRNRYRKSELRELLLKNRRGGFNGN
jgi:excisionase family DNA binding protein